MMMRRLLLIFGLLAVLSLSAAVSAQDNDDNGGPTATLRFDNLAADSPEIDLYWDDTLLVEALPGLASGPTLDLPVSSGVLRALETGAAPDSAPLAEQPLDLLADNAFLVVLVGSADGFFMSAINETLALDAFDGPANSFPSLYVNGVTGVDAVSVLRDGETVVETLPLGGFALVAEGIAAPANISVLDAANGDALLVVENVDKLPAYELRLLLGSADELLFDALLREILVDSYALLQFLDGRAYSNVGSFRVLLKALAATDLDVALAGDESLRLYAPNDQAFLALTDGNPDALLADLDALRAALLYHAVPGTPITVSPGQTVTVTTLTGETITVTYDEAAGLLYNEGQATTVSSFITANGLVNVISGVLVPASAD